MSRKFAVLDLGTNTFHLLLATRNDNGSWKPLLRRRKTVKLGQGGIHLGYIAPQPFERGVKAILEFADSIRKHGIQEVYAFATSAIRSSGNGSDFVKRVRQESGIVIQVISGASEAQLIRDGVMQNLPVLDERVLIMDIGGGSTEFIIADKRRTYWKMSFDIGASRLLEIFSPDDPIRAAQVKQLEKYLLKEIAPLTAALRDYPVTLLVGASGSSESYARMIGYHLHGKDPLRGKAHYTFDLQAYHTLHNALLASTRQQRLAMKGLVRMRVDMIVLASITTQLVVKQYKFKRMMLSTYALKEGAAYRIAKGLPLP